MNRFADAGARHLDTGKTYRFQDNLLYRETKGKTQKPPAAIAGGGLDVNAPMKRSSGPISRAIQDPLIRKAGIGAARHRGGKECE
jgi:hypothetical protein